MTTSFDDIITPPQHWEWHHLTNHKRTLRYGIGLPARSGPIGTVFIFPGLSEFCEKYYELAKELIEKQYAVAVLDWFGQGLSGRHFPKHKQKRHAESFDHDLDDMHAYLQTCKTKHHLPRPWLFLGHSMGGNLTLRYCLNHPNTADSILLSTPLLGVKAVNILPFGQGAHIVHAFNKRIPTSYAFGQKDWSTIIGQHTGKTLTHDTARSQLHPYWFSENPELSCGGVTWGWLHAAVQSCKTIAKSLPPADTFPPTTILCAGYDVLVSNRSSKKIAAKIPQATLHTIKGAYHEIFMESPPYRRQAMHHLNETLERMQNRFKTNKNGT